jgi:cysteine-rich repeat protein
MRHPKSFGTALVAVVGMVASVAVLPRWSSAHDGEHKRIAGEKLKMSYDATKPEKSKFQFKTKDQIAIAGLTAIDPRAVPTSLIVRGVGPGDGTSGVIRLDPANWSAVGTSGWQYKGDPRVIPSIGVQKIMLKEGTVGGSLQIKAKGRFWPYDINGAQQGVEIFLNVGGDTYCAQYGVTASELTRNEAGSVQGKTSSPPAECNPICGNGIQELGEQCDDNNDVDVDTCNNQCQGCLPQDVEYNSTFDAIQGIIFDSPTYGCSNDTCHGASLSGGLDLRAGTSYSQLVNVASSNSPKRAWNLSARPGPEPMCRSRMKPFSPFGSCCSLRMMLS